MYHQCTTNTHGVYIEGGDYKNGNAIGCYIDVWLMYGQWSWQLRQRGDYKKHNAVGCYADV